MKYFDTHAHYYDERFVSECEEGVENLLDALFKDNLGAAVNVGTSPETSRQAIEQARKYENMYTAIGIHPSDSRFLWDVDSELADIESLIKDKANKCLLLGEIGLDYHYPDTDKEKQMRYFHSQMVLARELDMAICIHDRDAHGDVMSVIKQYPTVRGILHSYSGSAEMAEELVKLGYYISFSGTLTFTNAKEPKRVAARVPRDRVLIETDCPYLAPHPKRGTLNHSGNLVYTNRVLADIWGVSEEECAEITDRNARRILNL